MSAATGSDAKSQVAGEGNITTTNKVGEQAISGQIQAYSYLMTFPHRTIIGMDMLMNIEHLYYQISNNVTSLMPIGQDGLMSLGPALAMTQ
ncbi:hypothetical protein OsJ_01626 [Oryza sativa Japonica Group]|uniref:Uncharacterized protein n=1 Tax=Oryza sativa subsp. japonica TaxID=39947 RepID=B9EW94_ORYSJ|nr:hypothetical protein OsJ_01626 [Oryza sativa Japonica Group]